MNRCDQSPIRFVAKWICIACTSFCLSGCQPSISPVDKTTANSPSSNASSTTRVIPPSFEFVEIEQALMGSEFHDGQEAGVFSLPETTGGGLAIIDLDRDGRLDVICSGGGRPDVAIKSLVGHRGCVSRAIDPFRFVECTQAAKVDMSRSYNSAVITADYDQDGFDDFLVTGFDCLQLFHNLGDGTFELQPILEDRIWSSGAAFFDADNDGNLDLYVTHYADWSFDNNPVCPSQNDKTKREYCGPKDFLGLADALFENNGDGSFTNITSKVLPDIALRGLGVIAADLDDDRAIDLYVTNDVEPNLLYHNEGSFRFAEMGRRCGVAGDDLGRPEGSMGVAVGDFNLDGKFDLWVTNFENEVGALYRNNGKVSFTYASNSARIAATDESTVGWGTAFVDLDLDGDEDILNINGHLEKYSSYHQQRPQILENLEGKAFRLVPFESGYFKTPQAGRGLALADFDQDGRVDFAVVRINSEAVIVRNTTKSTGSYLALQLIGTASNRNAIGAVVRLKVGERTMVRQVYGGGSYASTSDRTLHFGIPESLAKRSGQITIAWPSGTDQLIDVPHWNQELTIIEGN